MRLSTLALVSAKAVVSAPGSASHPSGWNFQLDSTGSLLNGTEVVFLDLGAILVIEHKETRDECSALAPHVK